MIRNSAHSAEEAQIRRAQTGDQVALADLYTAYQPVVFRFLFYRTADQKTAEDLTAQVFERMIARLPRYRVQGVPFEAWLIRIARNLSVDHARRVARRPQVALTDSLSSGGDDPERIAQRSLNADLLAEALQQLKKNQRDVIILRFVADMPIKQVAAALGKGENAIKGLQRRGLVALRAILGEWGVAYEDFR